MKICVPFGCALFATIRLGVDCCLATPLALAGASAQHADATIRTTTRYRMESVIGGWADIANSSGGWIKPDVSGSWLDPKSVVVSSASSSLPEETALQLRAAVRCDDESILANGFDASWSVVYGPIFSSGSGWMTAHPVYEDTPATAQATAYGLTGTKLLTVLNTDPDNFGLYAGDDIDDSWQVAFYGVSNTWGVAGADYDGDGADNYYEFTAGTDPLSASEFFALKKIASGAGVEVGIGPLSTNRTYTVERAIHLNTGAWMSYTNISLSAPSSLFVIAHAESGTNTAFYRVAIHYPWRSSP